METYLYDLFSLHLFVIKMDTNNPMTLLVRI